MRFIARAVFIAALAFAGIHPASATTFPSLTLIYTANGVIDSGAFGIGTVVICTNQSGVVASVRWRFLDGAGGDVGNRVESVANGASRAVSTDWGTVYVEELAGGSNYNGRVAIYSTQSGVFCQALVATGNQPGNLLHMIRFNAHPGVVE